MRAGLATTNGRLVRALQTRLGLLGGAEAGSILLADRSHRLGDAPQAPFIVIEDLQEAPWASLTFTGTRHQLEVRLNGGSQELAEAVAALESWSEDADLLPGGHFLAEVQVTETAREVGVDGRMALSLRLDALTIEE